MPCGITSWDPESHLVDDANIAMHRMLGNTRLLIVKENQGCIRENSSDTVLQSTLEINGPDLSVCNTRYNIWKEDMGVVFVNYTTFKRLKLLVAQSERLRPMGGI